MAKTLYIVATPIGNLEDITIRALKILKEVDLILAEDTRVTQKLTMHYDIEKPILSYHHHSSEGTKLKILKELLDGKDIALVSDAGTPGISDPGNELIDFLLDKEMSIKIVPLPGASSLSTALSVCGFDVSKTSFLSFLPKKKRKKLFEEMTTSKKAFVFFESTKRLIKTLEELSSYLGERRVFVGLELTKMHEATFRGEIKEILEQLKKTTVKGEAVVVVEKA